MESCMIHAPGNGSMCHELGAACWLLGPQKCTLGTCTGSLHRVPARGVLAVSCPHFSFSPVQRCGLGPDLSICFPSPAHRFPRCVSS